LAVTLSPPLTHRALALLELARPTHWIKNAFVLAPLIFAGAFNSLPAVLQALGAMALFCLASSATYVFNDLRDAANDRAHPTKRLSRPIAAGRVSPTAAKVLLVALYGSLLAAWGLHPMAALTIYAYLALNIAYSLKLKSVPVVDLFCISLGFMLRVYAGAWAIGVPVSSWMLITTLSLSLYLATIKRRQELLATDGASRAVLGAYTAPLLERYAQLAATSAIVFYGLFITTVRPMLAVTVPLVMFGLFRYWYIVESRSEGENPTDVVWHDAPLIIAILAWGSLSMAVILINSGQLPPGWLPG